ncbi:factor VIII intron 22 protein isoform X2 [Agrilus planipennis]|uniref:Factor VIII intron 22 protein isoform X2 n=1 Tax=Agrilus planipennis TaxID=224129 RepID=A0A1W4X258_AGRPL|nr:factor VIII intron 22 protein isoform X2 [Agrilus planipennis]
MQTDILEQYKSISSRLKRRFLRKPNVADASNSFSSLAQQCEHLELQPYAGLCWIAAARCEGSLGNVPGELSHLVRSARNFLSAELKNSKLGCPSSSNENLQAAISSYAHTNSKYPESSLLGVGLNLEIVQSLNELNFTDSKDIYLQNALELSQNCLDSRTLCLLLTAENCAEKEISNLLENSPRNGYRKDILLKCEINRIIILLILRPTPNKLAADSAKLLEKYIWADKIGENLKNYGMSEDLFLLLQSLVLTCQSLETNNLVYLEGDLWKYFDKFQKELLRTLVQVYCH